MNGQYPAIALALLLGGCAASDDNKSNTPDMVPVENANETPPAETATATAIAAAATSATPTIASVSLVQDCPDAKAEARSMADPKLNAPKTLAPSMPAPKKKQSKSKRKGDSAGGFVQPCSQSTVQLAFAGQAGASAMVSLKEVRLKSADGKALGTLAPRAPSIWTEASGYQAWDGVLTPGADHKTSYKLGLPDWSAVETTLGGSSYGKMYTVEIDVEIDGTVTTLTSPQVERARPQIVKT
jgi:hypothetical protein